MKPTAQGAPPAFLAGMLALGVILVLAGLVSDRPAVSFAGGGVLLAVVALGLDRLRRQRSRIR